MVFDNVDLVNRRIAQAEAARKRTEAVNMKGRATDRRKTGEIRNRKDSITSFCSECITSYGLDTGGYGTILNAIRMCTATECHLYPWRTGKLEVDNG